MKSLIAFLLLLGCLQVKAQQPIEIKIEDRPSSQGIQPAFEVLVPQATPDEAIDLLKKTISPGGIFKKNQKIEKVKDEWQMNGVLINDITSNPLDIITQVSSFTGHIYVRFFLKNNGTFLGAEKDTSLTTKAALDFVRNYGVDLYRVAVERELKDEEKELRRLENERDNLSRKNNNFDDKIEDIKQEKVDLDDEASTQMKNLNVAKTSTDISSVELKELEKDLKSAEKELKRANNAEKKIERKLDNNETEQREIARQIERQVEVVEKVKVKLDNIR